MFLGNKNIIIINFLKILNIGKSINFIRRVCQDRSPIRGEDEKALEYDRSQEASGTCTVLRLANIQFLITLSVHFLADR